MSVIAIINQKGGCGKTTTTINLAAALAQKKQKTLIIDFDPQGHSSLGLGVNEQKLSRTISDVLLKAEPPQNALLNIKENLDLLPSNISLIALEQKLASVTGREYYLRKMLADFGRNYQTVIIDCPPHLGLLSVNALLAADKVLVPVEPSKFGLDGLRKLIETIQMLCQKTKHLLDIKYLLSLYEPDSDFAQTFAQRFKRDYGAALLHTRINRDSVIREAAQAGLPVADFQPRSLAYLDYLALANEIIIWQNQEILENVFNNPPAQPPQTALGVCFAIQNTEAQAVNISGDFNNWTPEASPLIRLEQKGLWYTFLPLQAGRYNYQFVIDGKHRPDPRNPVTETSPFGAQQSVVEIN
ncbi:MAG: AAA family ATPase [Candidatus Margulisbacteria bacterium]|jgi:chromosome partitioning protein|nr:AAA family ATPase [Candidatus Margulisiibacteriota bacterium]